MRTYAETRVRSPRETGGLTLRGNTRKTEVLKDFSLVLRRWLPVFLWGVIVLVASTDIASAGHTGDLLRKILEWFGAQPHVDHTESNFFMRKAAHVLQFVVFALLMWRGLRLPPALRIPRWKAAAAIIGLSAAIAFASEWVQMFFPSRGPSLHDVGLDMIGAVIGLLLGFGWSLLFDRRGRFAPVPDIARFLVTANLNLDGAHSDEALDALRAELEKTGAGGLLIAGGLTSASRADRDLGRLRIAVGDDLLVAFCLGEREMQGAAGLRDLLRLRDRRWAAAADRANAFCLDIENVELPRVVLCGTWGCSGRLVSGLAENESLSFARSEAVRLHAKLSAVPREKKALVVLSTPPRAVDMDGANNRSHNIMLAEALAKHSDRPMELVVGLSSGGLVLDSNENAAKIRPVAKGPVFVSIDVA